MLLLFVEMDQKLMVLLNVLSNFNTQGQSVTLIYVDGTKGWKNIQDSTSNVSGKLLYLQQAEQ